MAPIDYEQALIDPTRVFDDPAAVLSAPGLTPEQKQEILKRWEFDARGMQVAEDENMAGGKSDRLAEVEEALASLKRTTEEMA
jgi:hypothetical protein